MVEFTVQHDDVTDAPSDLLLLKHATAFFGADLKVATHLTRAKLCAAEDISPGRGGAAVVETAGRIAPAAVMFLGTPNLHRFTYEQMERFAARAVELLAGRPGVPVRTLTTTVHGPGYGLDAGESLQSLVRGFRAGLARRPLPALKRITFVERSDRTARILAGALAEIMGERAGGDAGTRAPSNGNGRPASATPSAPEEPAPRDPAAAAGGGLAGPAAVPAVEKQHVFVAMPFSDDFEDVYEYGIYRVVRDLGYVCEKVDAVSFTGDILKRIKQRIRTARFVIADLSDAKPNVYLEVGYAWGRRRPVILLARDAKDLHFDVKTHRCLFYRSIRGLSKDLEKLILEVYGPAGE